MSGCHSRRAAARRAHLQRTANGSAGSAGIDRLRRHALHRRPAKPRQVRHVRGRRWSRRIAAENPAAIFINGDVPWHGIDADYEVYRSETRRWRARHLRVYPALGNHEFSACQAVDLPGTLVEYLYAIARPALVLGCHRRQGCRHRARQRCIAAAGQRSAVVARRASRLARLQGARGADRHASSAGGRRANEQTHRPQSATERASPGRIPQERGGRIARRASWSAPAIFTTTSASNRTA